MAKRVWKPVTGVTRKIIENIVENGVYICWQDLHTQIGAKGPAIVGSAKGEMVLIKWSSQQTVCSVAQKVFKLLQ